ncbi:Hypothetical_protein [Hexamita inflata]|uniref:Hypothetical_protein n=1 Tax=Hexamita inflata TaxID=28002 RepID=A0AA86PJX6_9EUKA|nr:Hypothetical protein HINF_LOCUS27327 [Hexamita inflata]
MRQKRRCCGMLQNTQEHKRGCIITFLCIMFASMLISGAILGYLGSTYRIYEYSSKEGSGIYVYDNVTLFTGICVGTVLCIIGLFGFIITSCFCCWEGEFEYSKVEPHYYPTPNYVSD